MPYIKQSNLDAVRACAGQVNLHEANISQTARDLMNHQALHGIKYHTLRACLYQLKKEQSEDTPQEAEERVEEETQEPTPTAASVVMTEANDQYVYRDQSDEYVVFLPHRPRAMVIDGESVRAMKEAYSSWTGGVSSINEIARTFGMQRRDFEGLKRVLGWTHDSSPYTREDLITRSEDELFNDLAAKRERDLEIKDKQREWSRTVKDAASWRRFKQGTWEPVLQHVINHPPRRTAFTLAPAQPDFMGVFSPWDLHLNKLGVDGEGYEKTRDLVLETTERLVNQTLQYGAPERLVLWLGSDFANTDNAHGGTTRGTPQDNDRLPHHTVTAAYEVAVELIDRLRAIAPLTVRIVPGNHDRFLSWALAKGLHVAYNEVARARDVEVICEYRPHQVESWGKNMIFATHGDGLKRSKSVASVAATQFPEQWGKALYRYALVGHLHHIREVDQDGIHILQLPALSPVDRYHDENGYQLSSRGQVAHLFDKNQGMIARLSAFLPAYPVRYN